MLFTEIERDQLTAIIQSTNRALSPKLDGRRVISAIVKNDGEPATVTAYGRNGQSAKLPDRVTNELMAVPGPSHIVIDGELMVSKRYLLFDLIEAEVGGVTVVKRTDPYRERQAALQAIGKMVWGRQVRLLPDARTPEDKTTMLLSVLERGGEGLVVRTLDAPYRYGERSNVDFKWKAKKTVDCVVVGKSVGGKANLVLAVYDEAGKTCDIGSVSALTGDGPTTQVGDVVEVQYLSFNGRLVQPTRPILRRDKKPEECHLSQLVRVNMHDLEFIPPITSEASDKVKGVEP